ncbi:MAG: hypothetical protein ACR652_05185 [Methylocystis sp.]|uniref:hypothetical protein n=1 Tax=Methylocystis sp. TaxID=1911079 RepID=UPI003DA24920
MTLAVDIHIRRWRVTLFAGDGAIAEACSAPGFDGLLAAAALAPALAPLDPGEEEIIVLDRLVTPPVELRAENNAVALATYAAEVRRVFQASAVRRRYRNRRDALRAMLQAAARQDAGDLWVWRALGLLGEGEMLSAAIGSGLRALADGRDKSWPVLQALAASGDLALIWPRAPLPVLAALTDALAPGEAASPAPASAALARRFLAARAPAWLALPSNGEAARASLAARLALASAGARDMPSQSYRRLLAGATSHFIAPSSAAPAHVAPDPSSAPERPNAPERLEDGVGGASLSRTVSNMRGDSQPDARPMRGRPLGRTVLGLRRPQPCASHEEAPERLLATRCAGLLFLLPLLPEAGLFDAPARTLFAHGGLTARLVRLATLGLGAPLSDPAVRAFAGLWPGRAPGDDDAGAALPEPPCSRAQARETARLVANLEAVLTRRGVRGLSLAAIVARDGLLSFRPAEIDLHMPLHSVDVDIRRTGLDATPGFIPWHGATVRFHYDES